MNDRQFTIQVEEDEYTTGGRCWVARIPAWNVVAQGLTPIHALTELADLLSHLAADPAWVWDDDWADALQPLVTSVSSGATASFIFPMQETQTR